MIQRVHISLDDQWQCGITLPDGASLPPRALRREKVPSAAQRDTPALLPWAPEGPGAPGEVQAMADRCRRIAQRSPAASEAKADYDVVAVGRHLFDTLFGGGGWAQIVDATAGATLVELALEWSREQRDLHRLNWEMMHGPDGFLAAGFNAKGRPVRVAVARVVREANAPVREPATLPRILFVIGCSLNDPRIRAGAEFFGLLRQIKAKEPGGTMVTERFLPMRIVQEASAARLRAALSEFRPEVVHFISHGLAEPDAPPSVLLQPDPGQQGEQWKTAGPLLDLLTVDAPGEAVDRWRPSVVILSTCFSGTVGGNTVVGGPWQGGPLAAELVAGGIPLVIGMAGQVADQACRLFTRTFGEALVYGKPLILAMEAGRRAAFTLGDWPKRSVDWALPAMYRARGVKADFAITAMERSSDEQWLQNVLGMLNIHRDREPVLAARFELLDVHYERLLRGDPAMLAVLGPMGSGKSRLLREFAAQAASQGHVPLLVSADDVTDTKLDDWDEVRLLWLAELGRTCDALDLGPLPTPCQLELLDPAADDKTRAALHPDVARALHVAKETLPPLLRALQLDLLALLAKARATNPARHPASARAWLLLDHLHLYKSDFQPGFFDRNVTPFSRFGLGKLTEVLPVVLAFNPDHPAAQELKPIAEGKCRTWIVDLTLDPFPTDDTDLLYYGRVLLSPHAPTFGDSDYEEIAAKPWIIDYLGDKTVRDREINRLRKWMKRQPADFVEKKLFEWIEVARDLNVVRVADDEDKLRQLQL